MKAANTTNGTPRTFVEGTITHIPLKSIVDHPDIIYRSLNEDHVKTLANNIEQVGLNVPLIVWNGGGEKGAQMVVGEGDDEKKMPASFLVAGAHRRAALKSVLKKNLAKYKELFPNGIPVIVTGGELKDVMTAQLRENVMREDMSPEQIFPVLQFLLKKADKGGGGMKQSEVAKAIGKSPGWVSQVLDVEEQLGEEGVKALENKEIGLSAARNLAKEVKTKKKAGEAVDPKEELKKAKAKVADRKAQGQQRAEKRVTPKTAWKRYNALPKMGMGAKLTILEGTLAYLAGIEEAELPDEMKADVEEAGGEDSDE